MMSDAPYTGAVSPAPIDEDEETSIDEAPARRGFTQVDNTLLLIAASRLEPAASRCLLYIIRHTEGFHAASVALSIEEYMHGRRRRDGARFDDGTRLSKQSVITGLRQLVTLQLIDVRTAGAGRSAVTTYSVMPEPAWAESLTAGLNGQNIRPISDDDAVNGQSFRPISDENGQNIRPISAANGQNIRPFTPRRPRKQAAPANRKESISKESRDTKENTPLPEAADAAQAMVAPPASSSQSSNVAAETEGKPPALHIVPASESAAEDDAPATPPAPPSPARSKSARPRKLSDEALAKKRAFEEYTHQLLTAIETAIGSPIPNRGQERQGALWFYNYGRGADGEPQPAPIETVMACYQATLLDPFWDTQYLSLITLQKKYAAYTKSPGGYVAAMQRNRARAEASPTRTTTAISASASANPTADTTSPMARKGASAMARYSAIGRAKRAADEQDTTPELKGATR